MGGWRDPIDTTGRWCQGVPQSTRAALRRAGRGDRSVVGPGRAPPPWPCARGPRSPGPSGRRSTPLGPTAGDLGSGSLGEHGPAGDLVGLLGPRAQRASRFGAAPQALGPHQHDRPTRRRPSPTARTTQDGHQARCSVVSTASHHSPLASSSSWAHTTNASSPSSAETPYRRVPSSSPDV